MAARGFDIYLSLNTLRARQPELHQRAVFLFFKKVFLFLKIIALFFNRFIKIHLYICRLHQKSSHHEKKKKILQRINQSHLPEKR